MGRYTEFTLLGAVGRVPLGEVFASLPDAMLQFDNQLGTTLYSPLPLPQVPATRTVPLSTATIMERSC
jgi:hypothetical protein